MESLAPAREAEFPTAVEAHCFTLDTPGSCHVVVQGDVILFAVRPDGSTSRHPIGRIGAGGLLFGASPSLLGEETLLAVRSASTRVYRLPDDWGAPEPPDAMAAGAAIWMSVLAGGLGQAIEPKPRPDIAFSGGAATPVALPANAVVSCNGGVVWIDLGEGTGQLFGIEPIRGLVPLPAGAWLTLDADGEVSALSWRDGLARHAWWTALSAFNAAAVELLPIVRGLVEADEFNRIRARIQAEAQDALQTAGRFAEILRNPAPAGQEAGSDGLLDVLRILAREYGLRIQRPNKARRSQLDTPPTLEEIARASSLLLQRVELDHGWWRAETGALIARRRNGEPVGLVWRRGHYEEVRRNGERRRVTAAVAEEIDTDAHLLFPPLAAKVGVIGLLTDSLRRGGPDIAGFLVATLLGSLVGQILPLATSLVFGILVPAGMRQGLVQVGLLIVLIGFAGFLLQTAAATARQRLDARGDAALFQSLWSRILRQPLPALRQEPSALTSARANAGLAVVAGGRQFLLGVASTLGMAVSSLTVIAWYALPLAGLAAAMVMLHVAIGILAGWLQARAFETGEQLEGMADSQLVQMVNGIVKLRSSAAEERAVLRWADRFAGMRARLVRSRRVANAYESWLATAPVLASAALFALVQHLTSDQDGAAALPISAVVAVVTAFTLLFASVSQFLHSVLAVWLLKPSWTFSKRTLSTPPEGRTGLSDPGPLTGEIEFANVGFAYEGGEPLLSSVSFRATAGEMIAIVGPSGSGKSTLIRLLLGMETPSSGAIYLDGHDLRSVHLDAVRRQIGVVLQDTALPPGSILDIVRGIGTAGPEEVWQALAAASMAEEVAAMPMGLHTMLTDAGRTLSGGQVQRLALARAFLNRPPILVLDEATSALDNATQARAMETVLNLPATRIIVAHRISTIRQAGRILVLDGGRIVESGSYAELMRAQGRFARLARSQD